MSRNREDRSSERKRSASPRAATRSRSPAARGSRGDRDGSRDRRDDRGYGDRGSGSYGGGGYDRGYYSHSGGRDDWGYQGGYGGGGGYGGDYGGYGGGGYGGGYGGYGGWNGPPGNWGGGWGGYGGRGSYGGYRGGPPRRSRAPPRVSDEEKKTSTCIWVGNLPYNSTESDIREMFEKYGQLTRVTVPMDRTGQRNKGFAFVEFETRKEAEDAYDKVEGLRLDNRQVRLDWDVGRERKEAAAGGGFGGREDGGYGGARDGGDRAPRDYGNGDGY